MSQLLLIDEAWKKVPPATIKQYGYLGVILYVSRDPGKCGTRNDVDGLHAVGLGVLFVFEDSAQRALGGYQAGVADGQFAASYLKAVGLPQGKPVHAAIDFAVTAAQMPTVIAYLQGFAAGLGGYYQARVYGDKDVVDAMVAHGMPGGWQTCAWSGGVVDGKAALYQRLKPTAGMPGSYDEDVVLGPLDSIGLWMPGDISQPAQPKPAKPTPVTVPIVSIPEDDVIWLLKDPDSNAQYVGINGAWYHIETMGDLNAEIARKAVYAPVPDNVKRKIVAEAKAAGR